MTVEHITKYSTLLHMALDRLLPQLSPRLGLLTEAQIRLMLSADQTALLAACDGEQILGLLTLVWYDVPSGRKAWIEDVVVDAEARGMGAGEALVAAAQQLAMQIGAEKVMLTSAPHRMAARVLYRKMDFNEVKTTVFVWKEDTK